MLECSRRKFRVWQKERAGMREGKAKRVASRAYGTFQERAKSVASRERWKFQRKVKRVASRAYWNAPGEG